jgi:hypothetical protein
MTHAPLLLSIRALLGTKVVGTVRVLRTRARPAIRTT